jgi:hypothetical protein
MQMQIILAASAIPAFFVVGSLSLFSLSLFVAVDPWECVGGKERVVFRLHVSANAMSRRGPCQQGL